MKILVVGSGGREHAIVRQVSESPKVKKIFCAPGNDGMTPLCERISISVDDLPGLVTFAKTHHIDLTIVGPEKPLVEGIVDAFKKENLRIFGPSQRASILEGSKAFMKDFCRRYNIPTAAYASFEDAETAKEYLGRQKYPLVIKADGLAAGKGVVIAQNQAEAHEAVNDLMVTRRHGLAGTAIVVEEFLTGQEASFIIVTDGFNFIEFPSSQDHKRIFDGDQGPNTGGMGAYAPASLVTQEIRDKVIQRVIKPTLDGMVQEGRPYRGFLYAGLMISAQGDPLLLEFNCRLGDPEAEVLLPLLECDLVELVEAALTGTLKDFTVRFKQESAVCVVMASQGYPGEYKRGDRIFGLERVTDPSVFVYHAGTKKEGDCFVTNGGRVLVVSALDDDLIHAIDRVYAAVSKITWDGVQYRRDVGKKGLY